MIGIDIYQVAKDMVAYFRRKSAARKKRHRAEKKVRYVIEAGPDKEPPICPSITGNLTRRDIEKMISDAYK
jgi:hypothetical protein